MADASDIAGQIIASETDASVAAAAAQTAVVAADAAVAMAEAQTAQVVAQAAVEIREAEMNVEEMKGKVSWLENQLAQTQATLEAQNMATMAELSTLKTLVESLVLKSADSPSQTPPASGAEIPTAVQVNNPSDAVVVQQEAAPPNAPAKPSMRLKRL